MKRRLIKPPLGIQDSPSRITCERRKAERLQDFLRCFDYVLASYQLGLLTEDFNASLARLKRANCFERSKQNSGRRLHPWLEILISQKARELAKERTGGDPSELTQLDVERAASWVAREIKPVRGRPGSQLLEHHAAGMMALIQEFSGEAVTGSKCTGSDNYSPHLNGAGRILLHLQTVNPDLTETQLVNLVSTIRRRYADKPMRFTDFYPLYGATLDGDGMPVHASPYSPIRFEPAVPIYCP